MIAAIVLAAGKSERMGGTPKALLRFRGLTFLEHILHAIEGSLIDQTVVIVGRHRAEIETAIDWSGFVFNPNYEQGMSTSIQAGIRALPEHISAAAVFLVDHPLIDSKTINVLVESFRPGCIIVPVHQGRRGHPVLFSRDALDEILALGPGEGANLVVRRSPQRVIEVPVNVPGVLQDIDTREDLEALLREQG